MAGPIEDVERVVSTRLPHGETTRVDLFGDWTLVGGIADGLDQLTTWRDVRRDLRGTGWDVVLSIRWGGDAFDLSRLTDREELGWDHRAAHGPVPSSWAPDEIIAAADRWTDAAIDAALGDLIRAAITDRRSWSTVAEDVDQELETTARVCGDAPDAADVPLGVREDPFVLDRWLLDWELDHADPPGDWTPGWFEPTEHQTMVLWAFPRDSPFAWTAVDHWWASDLPFELALFRRWHRDHGAALVSHFGTMLQVVVDRRPADIDEAWRIAQAQDLVSDALLAPSGIALRHHALGLLATDRWFLHSRP